MEGPSTPTNQNAWNLETNSFLTTSAAPTVIRSSPPVLAMDITTSPTLPATRKFNPQIDISGLSDDLSTDPLFGPTTSKIPLRLPKRTNPFSPANRINKNPRTSTEPASDPASAKILQARDLLIEALSLVKSREKQTDILDLIEIFREYTESNQIKKASQLLAGQINNLEYATRRIETKANASVNTAKAAQTKAKSLNVEKLSANPTVLLNARLNAGLNANTKPTFASVAAANTADSWTTVEAKKPIKKAKKATNRLILIRDQYAPISPLQLRNSLNKAFELKGIKGPVVSAISTTTNKKNLVITTTAPYTADFLIEKLAIWEKTISFRTIQKDEPWFKVVLHGIPTNDFNTPDGMELVLNELKTFNKSLGLKPVGLPYWLSSADNRATKRAGSVVVSFTTSEEVDKCIHNRVYIAGTSCRAERLLTVARSTQCIKCLGFGHVTQYCKKVAKCSLCSESHNTSQHCCSVCNKRGKSCSHLALKCANCGLAHSADSKDCEVYKATKRVSL
ncbi:hypothetical protein ACMFMG_012184 [Clarireedia jacksonii]